MKDAARLEIIRSQIAAIQPAEWSIASDRDGNFLEARGPMGELWPLARFHAGTTTDEMQFAASAPSTVRFLLGLVAWGHKMGPWNRPYEQVEWLHGLRHNGELVAVTAAAGLMRERCGGFDRVQAFELGRVCAARPHINRAMLRLWREFVFPAICAARGYRVVISYQDAVLHSGNLYRFDGWRLVGASRSGTDARSGRKGRSKKIWAWGACE